MWTWDGDVMALCVPPPQVASAADRQEHPPLGDGADPGQGGRHGGAGGAAEGLGLPAQLGTGLPLLGKGWRRVWGCPVVHPRVSPAPRGATHTPRRDSPQPTENPGLALPFAHRLQALKDKVHFGSVLFSCHVRKVRGEVLPGHHVCVTLPVCPLTWPCPCRSTASVRAGTEPSS